MATEIERKFLVLDESWRGQGPSFIIRQGYLSRDKDRTVRVRIRDEEAFLTVKGRNLGICRPEFEYTIPVRDAEEMLRLCTGTVISKTRHYVQYENLAWEVDEFHGLLEGLVVAECELMAERQEISKPPWVGDEVTQDVRYLNSNLNSWPFP
jgi:adenylate cyclase